MAGTYTNHRFARLRIGSYRAKGGSAGSLNGAASWISVWIGLVVVAALLEAGFGCGGNSNKKTTDGISGNGGRDSSSSGESGATDAATQGGDGGGGTGGKTGDAGNGSGGESSNDGGGSGTGSSGTGGSSGSGGSSGTNGSSGTGGESGSSGTGGSGGTISPSEDCPVFTDSYPGTNCDKEGMICSYPGSPCGVLRRCTNGKWEEETVCGQKQSCPESAPSNGDPCSLDNPASGTLTCSYGECPENTLRAVCDGDRWTVTMVTCPGLKCSDDKTYCDESGLCLKYVMPSETSFGCASSNPCGANPLSCDCAQSLCGGGQWDCTGAAGHEVTCTWIQ